ncbi:MAG: hypothetical protein U0174_22830 [Polyangiaceae bacterium]
MLRTRSLLAVMVLLQGVVAARDASAEPKLTRSEQISEQTRKDGVQQQKDALERSRGGAPSSGGGPAISSADATAMFRMRGACTSLESAVRRKDKSSALYSIGTLSEWAGSKSAAAAARTCGFAPSTTDALKVLLGESTPAPRPTSPRVNEPRNHAATLSTRSESTAPRPRSPASSPSASAIASTARPLPPVPSPPPAPRASSVDTFKLETWEDRLAGGQKVLFRVGEAVPQAPSVVAELAEAILHTSPAMTFVLVGHGYREESSKMQPMALAQARVDALQKELVARGVPARRLSVRNERSGKPIARLDTPEGVRDNARVDVIMVRPQP